MSLGNERVQKAILSSHVGRRRRVKQNFEMKIVLCIFNIFILSLMQLNIMFIKYKP